tara:strand:- start:246 stop:548 length:303 start_codon:yes stop_codon:yes gene_type:complete
MISLLKILAGLFKAFPKLADIFENAVRHYRNAQAEAHRVQKDADVDAFIANANGMSCDTLQWVTEDTEYVSTGSEEGGTNSTKFYEGNAEGDQQARSGAR